MIGVIGGSGLYEMEGVKLLRQVTLDTPFGEPSDAYVIAEIEGKEVAFLPRHGKGHRLLPTEINYRANIYGFKSLGVERIISVSAVGSMKEAYKPKDVVIPDQFFDRTRHRKDTFFGDGLVAHVSLAHPICPELAELAYKSAQEAGAQAHLRGCYLCMEGPQFSTKAESLIYRQWGVDVIGMTNLTEARLAREGEICYVTLAMVTDYDCWHEGEEDVTGEAVMEVVRANTQMAQNIVFNLIKRIPEKRRCACKEALKHAFITAWDKVPQETLKKLEILIKPYLPDA